MAIVRRRTAASTLAGALIASPFVDVLAGIPAVFAAIAAFVPVVSLKSPSVVGKIVAGWPETIPTLVDVAVYAFLLVASVFAILLLA